MAELLWGYHIQPFPGEVVSGDAVAIRPLDGCTLFAIVDGLGHGEDAHRAAILATGYVERHGSHDLLATMAGLHDELLGTRGAAVGLCLIEPSRSRAHYCGIGNTVIRSSTARSLGLFSHDGIVGQRTRRPRVQHHTLEPGEILILHTDGIPLRADVFAIAGLFSAHPGGLARLITQRHARTSDDAGCVVIRYLS